jgi:hypothetical protein
MCVLGAPAFAADAPDLVAPRAVASSLAQQLGAELKKELAANGPESAIAVCSESAPRIAGELSRHNGWKVTRVSLKPRNPMLGMPDAWEQQALQGLEARAAAGEKPEQLEIGEVVSEPTGNYLRYVKAIPLQPACVVCHGSASDIPAAVKARLHAQYPHDGATGYAPGMLRGAISIKQPLPAQAAATK